jgi:hypothetical protein
VAWDKHLQVLHAEAPRWQVRHVLEVLEACLAEQGGDRTGVLRLRPFTHSPEMGALIREEIDGFWRGLDPPSVCVFDGTSFGHPPRLHMELQAVAVVPDPAQEGPGARAAPPVPPARRASDEVGAVAMAAERRRAADLEEFASAVRALGTAPDDVDRFLQGDVRFHLALARATHGSLVAVLVGVLREPIGDSMRDVLGRRSAAAPIRRYHGYHRSILRVLTEGDAAQAPRVMEQHLRAALEALE